MLILKEQNHYMFTGKSIKTVKLEEVDMLLIIEWSSY